MQKRLFALLSCFSVLLVGCNSIKNENAIFATNNYERKVIEAKAETVEYMINEKYSFSLLMYTEQCNYCDKAKQNLNKLISELGYASYQIEMYTASISYLNEKLPDYYSTTDSYPFLYIINQGKISYKSNIEDLTNESNMKKMLKVYSKDSNITTLTTIEGFIDYKKSNSDFLLYTYDSSQIDMKKIYSNYLFSKASSSSKNLLIIDKMTANSDLILHISSTYGLVFDILSIHSEGEIKTTLNYASESGSNIETFIASYF